MITGFEKIVEERIRVAQRSGEFDNLPGSGKPLELGADDCVPEDLRIAYKILKNADCLPPEIEIKKEIQKTEELLAGMKDTENTYRVMKKLNFLIMKLNSLRTSPVFLEMPQRYAEKIVSKMQK
jgi:hypothetical protein